MTGRNIVQTVLALSILLSTAACMTANSPRMTSALQMISAGHTGCAPAENEISDVSTSIDGSGTWNARCKGKMYLCSAFLGASKSESYSCAPVAH
jgi:hypothetical protein